MALTWIDRSDAGKLGVGGPDALPFLQALLTADLAPVAVGTGVPTALLAPRGQVRALARALRTERGWLLHCERPALEGLFRGLWSGRVGWRVELHKLTLAQCLVSVVGDAGALGGLAERGGAGPAAAGDGDDAGPTALAAAGDLTHLPTRFGGVPVRVVRTWAGIDLVARADRRDALLGALARAGAEPLDQAGWDELRIARGRLAYGQDALDSSLPAELALDATIVATEKGLYPGLQTVLRQQRSGTVHRRLCHVHADHALLAPGDELIGGGAAGGDGRPMGRLTSALAFDGLALVRASATESLVHGPTGTTVHVEPLEQTGPSL
jgi:folate-binding Fe-S cluster repair protein YgfZ